MSSRASSRASSARADAERAAGAAGVAIIGAQLTVAPSLETLFAILYFFPLVFWVWMLWAGVLLWRRTPGAPA